MTGFWYLSLRFISSSEIRRLAGRFRYPTLTPAWSQCSRHLLNQPRDCYHHNQQPGRNSKTPAVALFTAPVMLAKRRRSTFRTIAHYPSGHSQRPVHRGPLAQLNL
jgi:hypothetical protein